MDSQPQQSFPTKRFLIFGLVAIVFLTVWNSVFEPPARQQQVADQAQKETTDNAGEKNGNVANNTVKGDSGTSAGSAGANNNAPAEPAKIFPERKDKFLVDGADVLLSSRGGRLVSETITKPERFGAAGDLFADYPENSPYFPFAVGFGDGIVNVPADYVYEIVESESVKKGDAYAKIVYRYTDPQNRYVFDKIFETKPDSLYQFNLTVRLKNNLPNVPLKENISLNIYGYEDPTIEHSFLETRADKVEAVCKLEDDIEREQIDKIEEPTVYNAAAMWAAIDRRHFVFAAVPSTLGTQCSMQQVNKDYAEATIQQKTLVVQPGETASVDYFVFAGPKNYGLLSSLGHDLRETVDFGMFSFLSRPLRWTLVKIQGLVGNWGVAIIILTIIIRLLLWPLNQIAYSQTEKMRRIQPKINEIKEKYKGDAQKIQEEQFKLMKESGTTPFGCLPMFIQFPILLALYFMILNSVELYHAHFILWYTNLAASDPYFVLPILMGLVMFIQQHFMTPEIDPSSPAASMQKYMKFMPVIFTVFMLFLPSGVVLYYFVSLLIGLGQQWYIRKALAKKFAKIDAAEAAKAKS